MSALLASRITAALAERLRRVRASAGYASDVGARVLVGQLAGSAPMAPCCYLIPGPQRPGELYGPVCAVTRTYQVRGFVDANAHAGAADTDLVDLVIWDLRRALELADATIGGLAERLLYRSDTPGYREDGGALVGAGLSYDVAYYLDLNSPTAAL